MSTETLTERQKREQEYYDEYAKTYDVNQKIDMAPIDGPMSGKETRPWNSYWAIYDFAIKYFKKGNRLLDFGSGPGENAVRFATIGYDVEGFDISQKNIDTANKLFEVNNLKEKGNFQITSAEKLDYETESFDLIVGVDILHHVDIPKSVSECYRVLKNGGRAFFREPIEVPLLDMIRNTKIVKMFAPKEKSFELHITEDERKLNSKDVEIIKNIFPNMVIHRYLFLARFDKYLRDSEDPKPSFLEKVDHFLMKYIPGVKHLGGVVIFELRK